MSQGNASLFEVPRFHDQDGRPYIVKMFHNHLRRHKAHDIAIRYVALGTRVHYFIQRMAID